MGNSVLASTILQRNFRGLSPSLSFVRPVVASVPAAHRSFLESIYRDGEVPQMTTSPQSTSPRIWEDLAPVTGPQYRSLLCLSRKNRTSSPLQVLNFRGLVLTAGTVLPVPPPIPAPWHPSRPQLSPRGGLRPCTSLKPLGSPHMRSVTCLPNSRSSRLIRWCRSRRSFPGIHLQQNLGLAGPLCMQERDLGENGGLRRYPRNASRFPEGLIVPNHNSDSSPTHIEQTASSNPGNCSPMPILFLSGSPRLR